jgi:hypothetical protein
MSVVGFGEKYFFVNTQVIFSKNVILGFKNNIIWN